MSTYQLTGIQEGIGSSDSFWVQIEAESRETDSAYIDVFKDQYGNTYEEVTTFEAIENHQDMLEEGFDRNWDYPGSPYEGSFDYDEDE